MALCLGRDLDVDVGRTTLAVFLYLRCHLAGSFGGLANWTSCLATLSSCLDIRPELYCSPYFSHSARTSGAMCG